MKLSKRDQYIIRLREETNWSYERIGKKFHITRQRVTQIYKRFTQHRANQIYGKDES